MPISTLLATRVMAILNATQESEYGLRIGIKVLPGHDITQPTIRARQLFYRFQADLAPAHDNIQIRLDPQEPDKYLWFIKRSEDAKLRDSSPRPQVAGPQDFDFLFETPEPE